MPFPQQVCVYNLYTPTHVFHTPSPYSQMYFDITREVQKRIAKMDADARSRSEPIDPSFPLTYELDWLSPEEWDTLFDYSHVLGVDKEAVEDWFKSRIRLERCVGVCVHYWVYGCVCVCVGLRV